MMGGMGSWEGFGMGFGGIGILLLVGLVILMVYLAIRRSGGPARGGPDRGGDRSLEILRERYAAGEIDREEFERMKRTLEG